MNLFLRLLLFIVAEILGYLMLVYTERIVRIFGRMFWLEEVLGGGWTYNVWKISGLLAMFLGVLILLGKFSFW